MFMRLYWQLHIDDFPLCPRFNWCASYLNIFFFLQGQLYRFQFEHLTLYYGILNFVVNGGMRFAWGVLLSDIAVSDMKLLSLFDMNDHLNSRSSKCYNRRYCLWSGYAVFLLCCFWSTQTYGEHIRQGGYMQATDIHGESRLISIELVCNMLACVVDVWCGYTWSVNMSRLQNHVFFHLSTKFQSEFQN